MAKRGRPFEKRFNVSTCPNFYVKKSILTNNECEFNDLKRYASIISPTYFGQFCMVYVFCEKLDGPNYLNHFIFTKNLLHPLTVRNTFKLSVESFQFAFPCQCIRAMT